MSFCCGLIIYHLNNNSMLFYITIQLNRMTMSMLCYHFWKIFCSIYDSIQILDPNPSASVNTHTHICITGPSSNTTIRSGAVTPRPLLVVFLNGTWGLLIHTRCSGKLFQSLGHTSQCTLLDTLDCLRGIFCTACNLCVFFICILNYYENSTAVFKLLYKLEEPKTQFWGCIYCRLQALVDEGGFCLQSTKQ